MNFAYRSSKSMDDIYYTRTDMNFINEKWQYWWNGQHGGSEEMYHHPAEVINMDEIDQMMKFLHKLHLKRKMTIIQMIWFSSAWLTTSTLNLDFIHVTCVQGDKNGVQSLHKLISQKTHAKLNIFCKATNLPSPICCKSVSLYQYVTWTKPS